MLNPVEIGTKVGQAIARDVIADNMPRQWTGLDAQDGDQLTVAGIEPNTTEWNQAETAAEAAYLEAIDMAEIVATLRSAGAMFDGGSDTSRREIAEDWADHDFDAGEVGEWVAAGCWDASSAADLREAGFRPGRDELSYRPGEERDDMDAMYALCNADVSLEKLSW